MVLLVRDVITGCDGGYKALPIVKYELDHVNVIEEMFRAKEKKF